MGHGKGNRGKDRQQRCHHCRHSPVWDAPVGHVQSETPALRSLVWGRLCMQGAPQLLSGPGTEKWGDAGCPSTVAGDEKRPVGVTLAPEERICK